MIFYLFILLTPLLLIYFLNVILALLTSTKGWQKIQSCKVFMLVNKVTKMHFFSFFLSPCFFLHILTSVFSQFSLWSNHLSFDGLFRALPPKERISFDLLLYFFIIQVRLVAFQHLPRHVPCEPWRCFCNYISKYKFFFSLYISSPWLVWRDLVERSLWLAEKKRQWETSSQ